MPILVSRFAPGQISGVNLRRLQGRGNEEENRLSAGLNLQQTQNRSDNEENRLSAARGEDRQDSPVAARDQLPENNQRSEQLQAQLQGRETEGNGRANGRSTPTTVPPGVGAVRTEADEAVDRPGRLVPNTTSVFTSRTGNTPAAQAQNLARTTLARAQVSFSATAQATSGRGGAANVQARSNRPALPEAQTSAVPPLDRETDSRIRQLAAQNRPQAVAEPEQPPTAVEISRANTTPEIRENLQANAQEVGQGLQQEARVEARRTAEQAERSAERATENNQEREVRSSRSEVRELQAEERGLERELAQTEREIRQRQAEINRQGSAPRTSSGPRIDLLAV